MKPFEFIDLAQKLAVQPALTPALLRTISSRAYYGAFHLAKEFLARHGQTVTARHDAHIWLVASQADEPHNAGRILAEMNNVRIRADYHLNDPSAETIGSARRSVERAIEFQSLLQRCNALPLAAVLARRGK